jgi:hypothetical protein
MCGNDIPNKLNEENREKQFSSFTCFPVNILQEKIKKGKVQQRPSTPAKNLAYPIPESSFVHHTNLMAKCSFVIKDLISGEKHCLKG